MADEMMKKSSASSILANDTAPKSAKMGAGAEAGKPKAAASDKKPAAGGKKKHKHTHIEHHDDGSHTVRHTPADGGADTSYAAQDLDGVHDGLEAHVGDANGDADQQQAPDAGQVAHPTRMLAHSLKPSLNRAHNRRRCNYGDSTTGWYAPAKSCGIVCEKHSCGREQV